MEPREKAIALATAVLVVVVGIQQGQRFRHQRERLQRKLTSIDALRERLAMLSGTKKRRDALKAEFLLDKPKSLQQIGYSVGKHCGVRIIMAMPRKESGTAGLIRETVSLTIEATYEQLMCYVKAIEQIKGGLTYVGAISVNKEVKSKGPSEAIYQVQITLHRLSLSKGGGKR